MIRKKTKKPDYNDSNLMEDSLLVMLLIVKVFLFYMMLDMITVFVWWLRVIMAVGITGVIYYICTLFGTYMSERDL